jgi:hypothetical protein
MSPWYEDKTPAGSTVSGEEWNDMVTFLRDSGTSLIQATTLGSGTASTSTYLRGDLAWESIPTTTIVDGDSYFKLEDTGTAVFTFCQDGEDIIKISNYIVQPSSDNLIDIGTSTERFKDVFVSGTNMASGHKITISTTEPTSPSNGDVWIDIT